MPGMVLDLLLVAVGVASVLPNLSGDLGPLPLVILAVAPLLVRRRWPVPVFGWVLAGSAVLGLWSPTAVPGIALLVGLYTVAASRPLPVALAAASVLEVGVVVAAVRQPGPWPTAVVLLTGLLVAALGLGLYVAAHHALVAGLRDRAGALERDRDQQAALAAAAERARIAREMHDIVAHHLTVMVALSDGAAVAGPRRGAEAMRTVAATGRRALAETRRVVGVLRADPVLQPAPGIADLSGLAESVRAAGVPTTVCVRGPAAELPAGVQLAAYRVVQEALTNTLKHAGPGARAEVRLDSTPTEVHLAVTDTGPARIPAGTRGGSGLVGMRERVGACGGDLRAGPATAGGWRVAASLLVEP
jgi:signal transduction histidine kinase